jgi:hypothetical protein
MSPGTHVPFASQVDGAVAVSPTQLPVAHWAPGVIGAQTPLGSPVAASRHDSQTPVHADSQQTPSTQKSLTQSVGPSQFDPSLQAGHEPPQSMSVSSPF